MFIVCRFKMPYNLLILEGFYPFYTTLCWIGETLPLFIIVKNSRNFNLIVYCIGF